MEMADVTKRSELVLAYIFYIKQKATVPPDSRIHIRTCTDEEQQIPDMPNCGILRACCQLVA